MYKTNKMGRNLFFFKEKQTPNFSTEKISQTHSDLWMLAVTQKLIYPHPCEQRFRCWCGCLPEATHSHELSARLGAGKSHIFLFLLPSGLKKPIPLYCCVAAPGQEATAGCTYWWGLGGSGMVST